MITFNKTMQRQALGLKLDAGDPVTIKECHSRYVEVHDRKDFMDELEKFIQAFEIGDKPFLYFDIERGVGKKRIDLSIMLQSTDFSISFVTTHKTKRRVGFERLPVKTHQDIFNFIYQDSAT